MIGLDPDGDERWNAALPFVVDQVPSGAVFNVAPFAFPVGQVWLQHFPSLYSTQLPVVLHTLSLSFNA